MPIGGVPGHAASESGAAMAGKSTPERRIVQQRPDKRWEVVKPHHERASAITDTQREARDRGREIVANLGGGELTTKSRHGKFRDSDTVPHGKDPCPPKDRK
jgi:hypothetical protein